MRVVGQHDNLLGEPDALLTEIGACVARCICSCGRQPNPNVHATITLHTAGGPGFGNQTGLVASWGDVHPRRRGTKIPRKLSCAPDAPSAPTAFPVMASMPPTSSYWGSGPIGGAIHIAAPGGSSLLPGPAIAPDSESDAPSPAAILPWMEPDAAVAPSWEIDDMSEDSEEDVLLPYPYGDGHDLDWPMGAWDLSMFAQPPGADGSPVSPPAGAGAGAGGAGGDDGDDDDLVEEVSDDEV